MNWQYPKFYFSQWPLIKFNQCQLKKKQSLKRLNGLATNEHIERKGVFIKGLQGSNRHKRNHLRFAVWWQMLEGLEAGMNKKSPLGIQARISIRLYNDSQRVPIFTLSSMPRRSLSKDGSTE